MMMMKCRIKVGAIDAAALGPLKKQAHGHGREKEKKLLYFGCDSLVGTISGKSLKLLTPDVIFYSENAPNSISTGALHCPRPRWGSLQRSSKHSIVGFKGAYF